MADGYDIKFNNQLEQLLEKSTKGARADNNFPDSSINRWDLYKSIKAELNDKFFRDVDGALTADSGGDAYTRHDLGHVNDVIRRVGHILGLGSRAASPVANELTPFEVFVLLVACLVHDAGNKFGREGHAGQARRILAQICGTQLSQKELSIISSVARAHGGTAPDGTKDTIGALREFDGIDNHKVRLQLLAALLRFGDELAENHRRANTRDVKKSSFPNMFCQCINVLVDYESKRISFDFTLNDGMSAMYGASETGDEMYFVDYIRQRVVKAELERRYCDQFLRGFATYRELRVTVDFFHGHDAWHEQIAFKLPNGGFYPSDKDVLEKSKLDGAEIAKSYKEFSDSGGTGDA